MIDESLVNIILPFWKGYELLKRDEMKGIIEISEFVRGNSVMVGEQNFANPRRKFTSNEF